MAETKRDLREPDEVWRNKVQDALEHVLWVAEKVEGIRARGYKPSADEISAVKKAVLEPINKALENLSREDAAPTVPVMEWKGIKKGTITTQAKSK